MNCHEKKCHTSKWRYLFFGSIFSKMKMSCGSKPASFYSMLNPGFYEFTKANNLGINKLCR